MRRDRVGRGLRGRAGGAWCLIRYGWMRRRWESEMRASWWIVMPWLSTEHRWLEGKMSSAFDYLNLRRSGDTDGDVLNALDALDLRLEA